MLDLRCTGHCVWLVRDQLGGGIMKTRLNIYVIATFAVLSFGRVAQPQSYDYTSTYASNPGYHPGGNVDYQPGIYGQPVAYSNPGYGYEQPVAYTNTGYGAETGLIDGGDDSRFDHVSKHSIPPSRQIWASAEYLAWFSHGQNLPPLVTTSPSGTPRNLGTPDTPVAGVLGQPSTSVLFGDNRDGNGLGSGGRHEIGYWLTRCMDFGVGGRVTYVSAEDARFSATSTGDPILARPFFNTELVPGGAHDAQLVAYPDVSEGNLSVAATQYFLSAEAFAKILLARQCGFRYDLIGGYHYSRLDSNLSIQSFNENIDTANPPVGTTLDLFDDFDVRNEFHGGELGILAQWQQGKTLLKLLGKISLGNMSQAATIRGQTVVTAPGIPSITNTGGLLTQTTNIGSFTQDEFVFVPEVGITLVRCLLPNLDLSIGYSFIYWSSMLQAADLIDMSVNLNQQGSTPFPGEERPKFDFHTTDFWMQGINLGMQLRF